MINYFWLVCNY